MWYLISYNENMRLIFLRVTLFPDLAIIKDMQLDDAPALACSVEANSTTCAFVTIIRLCASKIQPEPVDLTGVSLVHGTLQSLAAEAQNTCTTAGKNGSRLPRSSSSMQDVGVLSPALLWRLRALEEPPERARGKDAIYNCMFWHGDNLLLSNAPVMPARGARGAHGVSTTATARAHHAGTPALVMGDPVNLGPLLLPGPCCSSASCFFFFKAAIRKQPRANKNW
jgi:hypothetical protein